MKKFLSRSSDRTARCRKKGTREIGSGGGIAAPVALTLPDGWTGPEGALDARVNCVPDGRGIRYTAGSWTGERAGGRSGGLARGFVIVGSRVIEFFAEH